MLHFDKVLTSIGEFGIYQKRLFFYVLILGIPNGIHITSMVFNNVTPNFRCSVPGMANDTYRIQSPDHQKIVQTFIPIDKDTDQWSQCLIFANWNSTSAKREDNKTTECSGWVFEEDGFSNTLAVEFHLVCGFEMYKAHINMMALVGMIGGSLLGGAFADHFGRKTAAILGVVLQSILASAYSFINYVPLFMVARLFLSFFGTTSFLSLFVIVTEMTGKSKRSVAGMSAMFGFTVGLFLVALVHYLVRDWRTAQLVHSLPFIAYCLLWFLIQESPRWLLAKKRTEEAYSTIAYMAKVNNREISLEKLAMADTHELKPFKSSDSLSDDDVGNDVTRRDDVPEVKIWNMCTELRIAIRIGILCFSWVTINMVYYGLVLGVGDIMDGDIFVNFILQAVMELVSHMICLVVLERKGRKTIFCANMAMSSGALLGIALLIMLQKDLRWLSLVLYCTGKLCITMAFTLVFIVTTELLPTNIRNFGLGFCSFVARASGGVTPYVVAVSTVIPGSFGKALPLLVFGVFTLVSASSALLLPETQNVPLPESFKDGDQCVGPPGDDKGKKDIADDNDGC